MSKILTAGLSALFITVSSLAYAQTPREEAREAVTERVKQLQSIDWKALTDRRIEVVKAALQLKPDQEKYWPAVEKAIRERAQARQQRLEKLAARVNAQGELNPITFMRDRAESLSQRSAELNKLAEAWQPLYESLDADQKGRLRFLAVYVLHEVREARENRMKEEEDED
jgi:zinc resistance-associated protein